MEITPRELRDVEIRESFRGYSRDEVNELLERAAATLDAANERMQQMSERLSTAQSETGHTRETEDILHRTLLLAQRAADEAVGEATAKARQMLDDAEIQSRRLIADSEAEARRRGETERRRLEEEIIDLAGRRDLLLADVEALTRFEADYRDRMVRALEADLTALRSRPPASPGARPEPSDVELPVMSEGFARREQSDTPASSAPTAPVAAPEEVAAPQSVPAAAAASSAFTSPPAAPAAPSSPPWTPPAPAAAPSSPATSMPAPERSFGSDASTQAVDVQSLFDRTGATGSTGSPMAFEQAAATTATAAPTATPSPADAADPLGGDAIEAEVLDDDAFFATLREAVHDETPLGPREEGDATGENMFFDQESDSAGFRDVFRRRR
jgi:cell division initiation protein